MPFSDLQSFLTDLESRGQLKRIVVEVDPITDKSCRLENTAGGDQSEKATSETPRS